MVINGIVVTIEAREGLTSCGHLTILVSSQSFNALSRGRFGSIRDMSWGLEVQDDDIRGIAFGCAPLTALRHLLDSLGETLRHHQKLQGLPFTVDPLMLL